MRKLSIEELEFSSITQESADEMLAATLNFNESTVPIKSPVEIHYLWCGTKFSFSDYASLKSVFSATEAAYIHVHSQHSFLTTPDYVEWFRDVQKLTPFLQLHNIGKSLCSNKFDVNWQYVVQHILPNFPYGSHVFVQNNIIVSGKYEDLDWSVHKCVLIASSVYISSTPIDPSLAQVIHCATAVNFKLDCLEDDRNCKLDSSCFYMTDRIMQPRDIMSANNSLAARIRALVYGSPNIRHAKKHTSAVIPKIGHYCYFNNDRIDFSFYLSIISLLFVVKVDCVVVHGNKQPAGPYWEDAKQRGCVRWQYTPLVDEVWGSRLNTLAHQADVGRAEVFVRYGGLHIDPDVYFIRSLPDVLWHYDAVLALDAYSTAPMLEAMPREMGALVNLGVCMSRPDSPFFRLYQQTQRQYYDNRWLYNSGVAPFHIYERRPDLALLVPNMQMICNGATCYPGWARNASECTALSAAATCLLGQGQGHSYQETQDLDRKRQSSPSLVQKDTVGVGQGHAYTSESQGHVYAVHLVKTPEELATPASLLASDTSYAHIAKRILNIAGIDLRTLHNQITAV